MANVARYRLVKWVAVLMCMLWLTNVFSQNKFALIIRPVDRDSISEIADLKLKTQFISREEASGYIDHLPGLLASKGYISASLDSISETANQVIVYLYTGAQYANANIKIREEDISLIREVSPQLAKNQNAGLSFGAYQLVTEKLLDHFENTGYPFAKISLDSLHISDENVAAVLKVDKGFPYHIDSIRLYGPAKISRNFIHHYLNIYKGSLYNRTELSKIDQRLLELPYLQQERPWDMTMLNTGGLLNLYLETKKSNQINVLAGFLPANQQLGGKLLLTVDANLQLQNAFGGGETMGLVWQQIQPGSPRLHLNFAQPYLFNSPFGVDFVFDLYKRDSAFLNITGQLGLLYVLSPTRSGKIIAQVQQTNVLQVDTLAIITSRRLPDVADVSAVNLGFDYSITNTDYKFNPRRGSEITFSATVGNKTIRQNTAITQLKDPLFDYSTLYDSIKLKTYQLRLVFKGAHYIKTGKQSVLKTAVNAGMYQSPNFFATNYSRWVVTACCAVSMKKASSQTNMPLAQSSIVTSRGSTLISSFSPIWGGATIPLSNNTIPTWAGVLGLSIETRGGIFNISYAVGKRNDLPFDIKQSKIHFGYVSIF